MQSHQNQVCVFIYSTPQFRPVTFQGSVSKPHVASHGCIGLYRYRTLLSSQKILVGIADIELENMGWDPHSITV